MVSEKQPHGGEQSQGGVRDIKADIIEGLDDRMPALKRFF